MFVIRKPICSVIVDAFTGLRIQFLLSVLLISVGILYVRENLFPGGEMDCKDKRCAFAV